jgi:hypothetical protein
MLLPSSRMAGLYAGRLNHQQIPITDATGTFRWSFGLGAFTSAIAALLMGFLRKPKEI